MDRQNTSKIEQWPPGHYDKWIGKTPSKWNSDHLDTTTSGQAKHLPNRTATTWALRPVDRQNASQMEQRPPGHYNQRTGKTPPKWNSDHLGTTTSGQAKWLPNGTATTWLLWLVDRQNISQMEQWPHGQANWPFKCTFGSRTTITFAYNGCSTNGWMDGWSGGSRILKTEVWFFVNEIWKFQGTFEYNTKSDSVLSETI